MVSLLLCQRPTSPPRKKQRNSWLTPFGKLLDSSTPRKFTAKPTWKLARTLTQLTRKNNINPYQAQQSFKANNFHFTVVVVKMSCTTVVVVFNSLGITTTRL